MGRSLAVFVRRPQVRGTFPDGPASENHHKSGPWRVTLFEHLNSTSLSSSMKRLGPPESGQRTVPRLPSARSAAPWAGTGSAAESPERQAPRKLIHSLMQAGSMILRSTGIQASPITLGCWTRLKLQIVVWSRRRCACSGERRAWSCVCV
jgi:hypothetical protein